MAFDLGAPVRLRREDFFVSASNATALAAVEDGAGWPGGKLMLVGPAGAGKTHLAHVWAAAAGAVLVDAKALAGADLPSLGPRVVVEDAQSVAGDRAAEAALFHLHNLILPAGRLLITAGSPPRDWGMALPDLASRMQAASLVQLDPPDDALLSAVLIKLFADRQIVVPPNLIAWLVPRIERSLSAAAQVVARLDAAALAQGRAVTRAFAGEVLDKA
jgi:chromosomal replication initiation ATPase DnaA